MNIFHYNIYEFRFHLNIKLNLKKEFAQPVLDFPVV